MTYKYFGKVFKIPFPFTDLSGKKGRPALAVSEPDELNDIEFLFITTKKTRDSDRILSIHQKDYSGKGLPFESIVHVGKPYLLNISIIRKYLCQMSEAFMERVLRELSFRETTRFYTYFHARLQEKPFVPGKSRINYAGRVYDEKEMTNLVDSALDFWLTTGRYTDRFERDFADFLGVKYSFLVNSGSSANLLAFMSLTSPLLGDRRIKRGDEVLTVAAGFPTTVAPIIQYGALPVFVDVDLETANVDVSLLKNALSSKTKAVMLAHTLGNPFNIQAVKSFCQKYDLWLIEDNCDALGSQYLSENDWPSSSQKAISQELTALNLTGSFGDIGTSSFYPPHHMTMGEGGAVYTNSQLLKKIILSIRDWGRDCWCPSGKDNTCSRRFTGKHGTLPYGYDHKYVYSHFGYNLKPTDMQAAIGCAQLGKLPGFIQRRKENFQLIYDGLKGMEDSVALPKATPKSDPSWFGFLMTLRDEVKFKRNDIATHLEEKNIQTRNLFAGNLTRHPCFSSLKEGEDYRIAGDLKNTDKIMNDSFWIGVYPGMTEEMIMYTVEQIREFAERGRSSV
jgi:CDP-6-deoxy-D-xylo-4-hexulose-3-dehydrase